MLHLHSVFPLIVQSDFTVNPIWYGCKLSRANRSDKTRRCQSGTVWKESVLKHGYIETILVVKMRGFPLHTCQTIDIYLYMYRSSITNIQPIFYSPKWTFGRWVSHLPEGLLFEDLWLCNICVHSSWNPFTSVLAGLGADTTLYRVKVTLVLESEMVKSFNTSLGNLVDYCTVTLWMPCTLHKAAQI